MPDRGVRKVGVNVATPLVVKTGSKSSGRSQPTWPILGLALGVLAGANPFYKPHIPLKAGVVAWFAEMVFILVMSWHPCTARVGVMVAGLFLAVPCFLQALPMHRFLLMCGMALAFALVAAHLFIAPATGFRERLAYCFTWLGTREVKRRAPSFDAVSLRDLLVATLLHVVGVAAVKAVTPAGLGWLVRWLAGGIALLAFAEMVTVSHCFLTGLLGVSAPALMRSPHRSVSLGEFWAQRWNPAVSALIFGRYFFAPLARRGVGLALFAAFLASAVAHVSLLFMANGRWGHSLMWGAFFLVQPLLIAVERRVKVRRWRPAAAWVLTMASLAITSPLLVEPVLQLIEPTWGAPDDVLQPTLRVLGLVMVVNSLVALGSLASIQTPASPGEGKGADVVVPH